MANIIEILQLAGKFNCMGFSKHYPIT